MAINFARNIQTTKSIKKGDFTMDLMNLLKLNLQFFSQDDTGGSNQDDGNTDETTPPDDKKDDKQDGKVDSSDDKQDDKSKDDDPKFTQKQLDDIVKDRIKRAEQDKQEAIKEAEKLAKMTADQKREYELEKLQRENEELKQAQTRYELGKEATKILAESNITATDEILDFVVREDADKTSEAVKAFSDLVDRISDDRMKEKLKGKSPKKQQGTNTGVTKESIMAIKDGAERIKAIQENSHLFN